METATVTPAAIDRIRQRIGELHILDTQYSKLRLDLAAIERTLAAIKYGHIEAGLEGPNEKAREAYLYRLLSEDQDYVAVLEQQQDASRELGKVTADLLYQKRLYSLDILTTFPNARVMAGMELATIDD